MKTVTQNSFFFDRRLLTFSILRYQGVSRVGLTIKRRMTSLQNRSMKHNIDAPAD